MGTGVKHEVPRMYYQYMLCMRVLRQLRTTIYFRHDFISPRWCIIHHPTHSWSLGLGLGLIHETRLRKCSDFTEQTERGRYESYANRQSIQILRNLQSTEWVHHQKIASKGCNYRRVHLKRYQVILLRIWLLRPFLGAATSLLAEYHLVQIIKDIIIPT